MGPGSLVTFVCLFRVPHGVNPRSPRVCSRKRGETSLLSWGDSPHPGCVAPGLFWGVWKGSGGAPLCTPEGRFFLSVFYRAFFSPPFILRVCWPPFFFFNGPRVFLPPGGFYTRAAIWAESGFKTSPGGTPFLKSCRGPLFCQTSSLSQGF